MVSELVANYFVYVIVDTNACFCCDCEQAFVATVNNCLHNTNTETTNTHKRTKECTKSQKPLAIPVAFLGTTSYILSSIGFYTVASY